MQNNKIFRLVSIVIVWLFLFHSAKADNTGENLYRENCSICHGNDGQGGIGIPLSLNDFLKSASNDYLKQTIRLGRPGRIMPSFYRISESDIDKIIQYISDWRKTPAPVWDAAVIKADPVVGKTLFNQKCSICHGENGKGGSGSGMRFSRTNKAPIAAPALNNQGLLNSAPDAMLHYIIKHGRESTPMPSAENLGLTDKDIKNLVSYIRSFQHNNYKKPLYHEEPASLIVESPYSFNETIENVRRAITDSNFVRIREQELGAGFNIETTKKNRQTIIYFCSFSFLYEALKIDPRAGVFLPCRITVTEQNGKVQIMSINPKHLSQLFNNNELDAACDKMHEVYTNILEDASL